MGVTTRHTRRILAAYREEGAAAVASSVVRLARTRYEGANHTHLSELLSERDGIDIGRTTLRRILVNAGLSSPRRRRPPKHRVRHQRMPREGMLIQIDGSHHPWLGDQAPPLKLALERRLLALCQPFLDDPSATQVKLCRRIERHIRELFVFVAEPDVPADNNAAERSLRHLVISRKISGGTRSEQGTESKMTLASIFGTWRAQGLNPLAACRQLLISPQL